MTLFSTFRSRFMECNRPIAKTTSTTRIQYLHQKLYWNWFLIQDVLSHQQVAYFCLMRLVYCAFIHLVWSVRWLNALFYFWDVLFVECLVLRSNFPFENTDKTVINTDSFCDWFTFSELLATSQTCWSWLPCIVSD